MNEKLLISIITPSLNRADMIATAIESVQAQNYSNVEHLIMDGGSTDGTLDILSKHSHLKVFSGQDNGMYDALNRGLALAQGEIIGFLNTDDEYLPGALEKVALSFTESAADAVAGRANMQGLGLERVESLNQYTDFFDTLLMGVPIFNAWFFRTSVFRKLGPFDASFRMAGDREYLIRFSLAGLRLHLVEDIIYSYRIHTNSLTLGRNSNQIFHMLDENFRIANYYLNILPANDSHRRNFEKWLRREALEACVQAIKNRNGLLFLKYFGQGRHYDNFFAVSLFRRIFRRFLHESTN
jgi:glycosyltransferase involved in cell wall biosynthesis